MTTDSQSSNPSSDEIPEVSDEELRKALRFAVLQGLKTEATSGWAQAALRLLETDLDNLVPLPKSADDEVERQLEQSRSKTRK